MSCPYLINGKCNGVRNDCVEGGWDFSICPQFKILKEIDTLKAEVAGYISVINNMHTSEEIETLKKDRDFLKSRLQTVIEHSNSDFKIAVDAAMIPKDLEIAGLHRENEEWKKSHDMIEKSNINLCSKLAERDNEIETLKQNLHIAEDVYKKALALSDEHHHKEDILQSRIDRAIPYIEAHDCCFDTIYRILRGEE